jgi:hypothetical protein
MAMAPLLSKERIRLQHRVISLSALEGAQQTDLESEIEKAVSMEDQLHRPLELLPGNRLRRTFTDVGVRMTITFGEVDESNRSAQGKSRRRVPVSATLEMGTTGSLTLPEPIPAAIRRGIRDHIGIGGRCDSLPPFANVIETPSGRLLQSIAITDSWRELLVISRMNLLARPNLVSTPPENGIISPGIGACHG